MTRNKQLQSMVEGGVFAAIALLLSMVDFFNGGQGGSVTPASMLPLVLYAVRWGVGPGIAVGFVYGTVKIIFSAKIITVASLFLDYSVAYMMIGLAGLFYRRQTGLIWGGLLGGVLRFLVHFSSGIILYAEYAPPGQPAWIYSTIYNGTYMLPELLILVGVAAMVSVPLRPYITGGDITLRQN